MYPEEKWALAGLTQKSKLVPAFPSDLRGPISRNVMLREARVRAEFAHLYPMLEAGAWAPAAVIADRVAAIRLLQLADTYVLHDRVLTDAHFEFRGGTPRATQGAA